MSKKWPFGFFVYSNVGDKEAVGEAEVVTEEKPVELVKVVWSEPPAAVVAVEEKVAETVEEILVEETPAEEAVVVETVTGSEDFDVEEDDDFPELEQELEIALEAAHQRGVKKQRIVTGISAGVALVGAIGLATGLAIHNHFKKKAQ